MAPLTVTASEARANFSKLGAEIVRTQTPVTVFKNSQPWLVIMPAAKKSDAAALNVVSSDGLSADEAALLDWSDTFVAEYRDVFEELAK